MDEAKEGDPRSLDAWLNYRPGRGLMRYGQYILCKEYIFIVISFFLYIAVKKKERKKERNKSWRFLMATPITELWIMNHLIVESAIDRLFDRLHRQTPSSGTSSYIRLM